VFNAGFIPILSNIATNTNFDIRKEAAYSLVNIASHGEKFMNSLPHQELLPGRKKIFLRVSHAFFTRDLLFIKFEFVRFLRVYSISRF